MRERAWLLVLFGFLVSLTIWTAAPPAVASQSNDEEGHDSAKPTPSSTERATCGTQNQCPLNLPGGSTTIIKGHALRAEQDGVQESLVSPSVVTPQAATYHLINTAGTLQSGEPTEGGLMTRTIWAEMHDTTSARYVFHTFGTDIDTVLAAYKGQAISNLSRITANDNTAVPGISTKQSLIQFDTAKGADYLIQIGSRNKAEGDVFFSAYRFPLTGGLAAFLIQYGGASFYGRDYVCDANSVAPACPSATFVVYNSSAQTLTVTPSTTLGAGVSGGAAFSLAPRALKVVTFTFDAGFDSTTVRTVSGNFVLTGKAGATVTSIAQARATVVIKPGTTPANLVQSVVSPKILTTRVNVPATFSAKVTNTSAQTAIGCHFQSTLYSELKTVFYRINPTTGAKIGNDNQPSDIAAHATQYFKVKVAAMGSRDGYFVGAESVLRCANSYRADQSLQGGYDVTASGYVEPLPSLTAKSQSPTGDVLTVPASGYAYFDLVVVNHSTTKWMTALTSYEAPFDDPANSKYELSVCQSNPVTKACLGAYNVSVDFNAVKNASYGLRLRVKAPASPKPLDADHRRVYLKFKERDVPYMLISTFGKAPRTQ